MLAGAELANVLNEGALEAVRKGQDSITRADIYNGMDRVLQVCTDEIPMGFSSPCTTHEACKVTGRENPPAP